MTTPSNLGTPRDTTSVLNGRSPGPSKKPRPNGEDGREISRGGQWTVAKLDELQRMYKVSHSGHLQLGADIERRYCWLLLLLYNIKLIA